MTLNSNLDLMLRTVTKFTEGHWQGAIPLLGGSFLGRRGTFLELVFGWAKNPLDVEHGPSQPYKQQGQYTGAPIRLSPKPNLSEFG